MVDLILKNIQLRQPKSPEELEKYYNLRWSVLREPWNMPPGSERVNDDDTASHIMAVNPAGKIIGAGRVHLNSPTEAQVRFMAVDNSCRKMGVGGMILNRLEEIAGKEGASTVILQARDYAIPFYEKNGYTILEKSYLLFDTIQHYKMGKNL